MGGVPGLPIRLLWDDLDRTYASLSELGIDLEFVLEREYLAPEDPKPVFTDSGGSRFRILVLSLEVVLCVRVPDEYDPSELKLVSIEQQELEIVVEVHGAQAHRALSRGTEATESFVAVAPEELEALTAPLRLDSLPASTLSWIEFDEAWLTCVDPAPPIRLRELLSRLLRHGRSRT